MREREEAYDAPTEYVEDCDREGPYFKPRHKRIKRWWEDGKEYAEYHWVWGYAKDL